MTLSRPRRMTLRTITLRMIVLRMIALMIAVIITVITTVLRTITLRTMILRTMIWRTVRTIILTIALSSSELCQRCPSKISDIKSPNFCICLFK